MTKRTNLCPRCLKAPCEKECLGKLEKNSSYDLGKDIVIFVSISVFTQIIALSAAIGIWSVGTLVGLAMVFNVLWKMFAGLALIVSVLALGQMKIK